MKHTLGICLLFLSISSQAGVSKWVDAEGKVHYSDIPPSDIKAKSIKSTERHDTTDNVTPATGVATPKTLAEREAEWKKTQKTKEEAAQKSAQKQEAASIKQKNCENARKNLATLENSPAIVTYDSKGERTEMDDASRKQSIQEARKAISTYCN